MKYIGTEFWVEYNFKDEKPFNIRIFKDEVEAKKFAQSVNGKFLETKCYEC